MLDIYLSFVYFISILFYYCSHNNRILAKKILNLTKDVKLLKNEYFCRYTQYIVIKYTIYTQLVEEIK